MKNLKLIFLALGCMAALSLTSCLKDDDNNSNGLSKAQIAQCVNAVQGSYTGKMVYQTLSAIDTVDVSWSIGADTMLVLTPFPAKAFADQIYNNDLRNALLESNPQSEVRCYLGFYQCDTEVLFVVGPQKVDFPVFYNNATHTLSLYFWADLTYGSYGYKNVSTGAMEARLVMAAAYLDNNETMNCLNGMSSALTSVPVKISTLIK